MTKTTATEAAREGASDSPPAEMRDPALSAPGSESSAESWPVSAQEGDRLPSAVVPDEHQGKHGKRHKADVPDELFLRSIRSFEAILVLHSTEKKSLANRINWLIQGGMAILFIIAFSILILLFSLSFQIQKISAVVANMNHEFTSVSLQMQQIENHITSMTGRVALLDSIQTQTDVMNREMGTITGEVIAMANTMQGVSGHVGEVRGNLDHISQAIDQMNASVHLMGRDMYRIGQPAQSMNKMFPFP